MANVIYNAFKKNLFDRSSGSGIDLDTDTIMCMLVTSTYTPNADTHTVKSDITNEVSGTGYTAGGVALSGVSVTQDNTNDRAIFTASNASWASATITARGAVLYKRVGGAPAGTDPIIAYIDFGADKSSTNGTFTIQWDGTNGILTLG